MKKLLLCLALIIGAKGFALLPPLAQSIKEIRAIMNDKRLYDSLQPGELIHEVVRVEEGYLVITTHYEMIVAVRYNRTGQRIGPAQFELEFHSPHLLTSDSSLR